MKTKINSLLIVSLLAILTLSAIQYYLISNTYQLKKEAFLKTTKKKLKFIEANERRDVWDDAFYKKLASLVKRYQNGFLPKEKIISGLSIFKDSINKDFNTYFQNGVKERDLEFPVAYQQQFKSIVLIHDNGINDTLVSAANNSNLYLGTPLNTKTRFGFNSNKWETDSQTKQDDKNVLVTEYSLHLEIKADSYIDIPNWKMIVFRKTFGIFLLSILSILAVIGLFVYALILFIKQKKITAVKTDFINNITHELKTPLATLGIATKTIQQESVQENTTLLNNIISTIDRQKNRLQKLIDQVLNNSLGIDKINLQKEIITDENLLETIVSDYQLTQHAVAIKTSLPIKETNLLVDKFHFTTALLNILDNAVKYGSDAIKIETKIVSNNYEIRIIDNGIGIAKSNQKMIFDKFYRVENTDIHNVKGLGLGLFYVNQIVKAHLGTIAIKSELKQGTTIIIHIPL